MLQIIHIEPAAPPKPPEGQPCNGCGVCCLSEPCPLGRWLSRRRTGACDALRWDAGLACYRCGALTQAPALLEARWPGPRRTLLRRVARGLLRHLGARWIAAGQGCDCRLEVERPAPGTAPLRQTDRQ